MRGRPAAYAVPLLLALTACAGGTVTRTGLERSFTTGFGNLYVRQQALLGHPGASVAAASVVVSCGRSGTTAADGPGDDWRCTVVWLDAGRLTRATYDVLVRPTGCWTADGPPAVVGPQQLALPAGGTAVNPLAGIDGCLDLS